MKLLYSTLIVFLFLCISKSQAQEDCKVLMEDISGSYEGDCKKGLAHGEGIAKGKDTYKGSFKRGVPDGKGVYTYSNGKVYEGEWNHGLKEGEGKLMFSTLHGDSVKTGFWRDDRYLGEKYIPPYEVLQESNVERYSIKKQPTNASHRIILRIRDLSGNISGITGFNMNVSSGIKNGDTNRLLVEYIDFPFEGYITYTAAAKMSGQPINVLFTFKINDPGTWEVVLKNQ